MLFTTFLLATSVATSGVLGALLFKRKPDVEPVKVPVAGAVVTAVALALAALGFMLV